MFTNKFYVKVGENVHNILITNYIYPVNSMFDINNTLDSEPITVNEIIRLASDIEIDKSSGIFGFLSGSRIAPFLHPQSAPLSLPI